MNSSSDPFTKNLSNSCLVGYYGGLNYGDELLLECLQVQLKKQHAVDVSILYKNVDSYSTYHKDYGFVVAERSILNTLKYMFRHRNIVVGGGGHWGLEANKNILLLSILLLVFRLLGKNIILLGVGYYSSSTRIGKLAAFIAAKSAHQIYARDNESTGNFLKFNKQTVLWKDIAETLGSDLSSERTITSLDNSIAQYSGKSTLVTLRRFTRNALLKANYEGTLQEFLQEKGDAPVHILMMEAKSIDEKGYAFAVKLAKKYSNVQVVPFDYNPLQLCSTIAKHKESISIRGLQYHLILTALIAGVEDVWDISYDKKCTQILGKHGIRSRRLDLLAPADFYGKLRLEQT